MRKQIFVSSTFKDFNVERDLLHMEVIPKLNDALRLKFGDNASFLDLRWGIDTSKLYKPEDTINKVLSVCVPSVIDSAPFFIVMLGDNYGSIAPDEIVRQIYSIYGLKNYAPGKSITEVEIDASPIFSLDNSNCIVLIRKIDEVCESYIDVDGAEVSKEKQSTLKNKIEKTVPKTNVFYYNATIDIYGNIIIAEKQKFIDFIISKLVNSIEKERTLKGLLSSKNVYEADKISFDDYIAENSRIFCGREKEQKLWINYIANPNSTNKLLNAPSGSGKSAFFAYLCHQLKTNSEYKTIYYFANLSISIPSVKNLLKYILYELNALPEKNNDLTYWGLFKLYVNAMNKEAQKHKIVIFVDSIEQIDGKSLIKNLYSVGDLPANVVFCLSQADPDGASLDNLNRKSVAEAFNKRTAVWHKELSKSIKDGIKNLPEKLMDALGFPALLSLALDKIIHIDGSVFSRIAETEKLMETAFDFNEELSKELLNIIKHTKNTIKKEYSARLNALKISNPCGLEALEYIALSNTGFTFDELIDIVSYVGCGSVSMLNLVMIRNEFCNELYVSENGNLRIGHESLRVALLKFIGKKNEQLMRKKLVNALLYMSIAHANGGSGSLSESNCREIFIQAQCTKDYNCVTMPFHFGSMSYKNAWMPLFEDKFVRCYDRGHISINDLIAKYINEQSTVLPSIIHYYNDQLKHKGIGITYINLSFFDALYNILKPKVTEYFDDYRSLTADYLLSLALNNRQKKYFEVQEDYIKEYRDKLTGGCLCLIWESMAVFGTINYTVELCLQSINNIMLNITYERLSTLKKSENETMGTLAMTGGMVGYYGAVALYSVLFDACFFPYADIVIRFIKQGRTLLPYANEQQKQQNSLIFHIVEFYFSYAPTLFNSVKQEDIDVLIAEIERYDRNYFIHEELLLAFAYYLVGVATQKLGERGNGPTVCKCIRYLNEAFYNLLDPISYVMIANIIDAIAVPLIQNDSGQLFFQTALFGYQLVKDFKDNAPMNIIAKVLLSIFWSCAYKNLNSNMDFDYESKILKYIIDAFPQGNSSGFVRDWFKMEKTNIRKRIEELKRFYEPNAVKKFEIKFLNLFDSLVKK